MGVKPTLINKQAKLKKIQPLDCLGHVAGHCYYLRVLSLVHLVFQVKQPVGSKCFLKIKNMFSFFFILLLLCVLKCFYFKHFFENH